MKALLILILLLALFVWLSGCSTPEPKPEPTYRLNERFEFAPERKAIIMQLIQMKIDPNLMPNKSWSRKNPYYFCSLKIKYKPAGPTPDNWSPQATDS